MSKRCKLQKEYYKEFGNYKGDGKYSDDYVKWLENEVLALRLYSVSNCGGGIPYDSLSDSFKKSIGSIEDNLNR